MNKEMIGSVLRAAIITLATGVSVNGYTVTGSDAEQIAGVIGVVFGILWSFLQKKGLTPL